VQSNGSADFQFQNAEAAGELLKTANVRTPVDIRVLFDSNNPRAKSEFALLGQYATAVGFNLIDVSTKDPRTVSATGQFDVLITTVALAGEVGGDPYWFTGGSVGQFADPALDALLVSYSAKSDALDQIGVLKQVDTELYLAKFGLPLYQVPALLVYGKRIKTIVDAPYGGSATYGYWNWTLNG
jgi:peptide/nickel transport system substrate-binding protein